MGLNDIKDRQWSIFASSAETGEGKSLVWNVLGLQDGIQWIIELINE